MAEFDRIPVEAREDAGKGVSRALRRGGRVPGIVYGDAKAPAMISIDRRFLTKEMHKGAFTSKLFELQLGKLKQMVLPRDVQLHPVTDVPLHVDFLRIADDAEIAIMVAVRFVDEELCDGLRHGGVLNIVRHEIELMCSTTAIPEFIEISLAGHDVGDSLHISQVALPDGVRPTIADRDFTIATIAAPTIHVDEGELEGEEEIEGEEGEAAEAVEGETPDSGSSKD
jgi:large subunit ribosomal protein L25